VALHKDLPPLLALRAFEAVARHLSFIKAASELSVTQSALSHQVQKLEQHLAIPGDVLNADNTVPVVPLIEDAPRQGLWVDVEV
jgi:predicted transcriptional regulator